jgi:hypothetical protein
MRLFDAMNNCIINDTKLSSQFNVQCQVSDTLAAGLPDGIFLKPKIAFRVHF